MITYLRGRLIEKQPTRVVIDVEGVGYEVTIPISSYDRLPSVDNECHLLTYMYVREDSHQLFGFMADDERKMFHLLMGTTGIGPKLAMSVLSGLTVREIKTAIVSGDIKRLSSVSGIGKKVAERMIVELKDKISSGETFEAMAGKEEATPKDTMMRDAVLALISLGYTQETARKMVKEAVSDAPDGMNLEDLIRKALAR